jgi:hypothetical protein
LAGRVLDHSTPSKPVNELEKKLKVTVDHGDTADTSGGRNQEVKYAAVIWLETKHVGSFTDVYLMSASTRPEHHAYDCNVAKTSI